MDDDDDMRMGFRRRRESVELDRKIYELYSLFFDLFDSLVYIFMFGYVWTGNYILRFIR